MRARTVLAAVAFAGTLMLGGAGQALADDNDDMGSASDFGTISQPAADFGQPASGFEQGASGAEKGASGIGQGGPEFAQPGSGLGQSGSVFDRAFTR
ncbi:hypothetical protein ACFZCP_04130 [Streptomyces sp. NPDC007971]|uniref:hypothetical protein n=1 Tax=Streptomyces sp. NPDC007971 TaxID=3364799 RepID=UPI0036F16B9E